MNNEPRAALRASIFLLNEVIDQIHDPKNPGAADQEDEYHEIELRSNTLEIGVVILTISVHSQKPCLSVSKNTIFQLYINLGYLTSSNRNLDIFANITL